MNGVTSRARQVRLRRPSAVLPVLSVVVLGIFVSACSSTAAPTTTTTTVATTTSTSSGTSSSSTTVPAKGSADADIAQAYKTLFDLASPAITPKLAVVQDGSALRAAFTAAIKSPLAKEAGGARVLSVTIEPNATCSARSLPPPCADVIYDVVSPGKQTLLANQKGAAISSGGHWLVAKQTICTLLAFTNGGAPPSGC